MNSGDGPVPGQLRAAIFATNVDGLRRRPRIASLGDISGDRDTRTVAMLERRAAGVLNSFTARSSSVVSFAIYSSALITFQDFEPLLLRHRRRPVRVALMA